MSSIEATSGYFTGDRDQVILVSHKDDKITVEAWYDDGIKFMCGIEMPVAEFLAELGLKP